MDASENQSFTTFSKMSLGLKTVEDNGKLCDLGNVGGETAAMDACKIVSALIYECNTIHK